MSMNRWLVTQGEKQRGGRLQGQGEGWYHGDMG
jgi:hypothetical protein